MAYVLSARGDATVWDAMNGTRAISAAVFRLPPRFYPPRHAALRCALLRGRARIFTRREERERKKG